MRLLAREGKTNPYVRYLALDLVKTLPQKDYAGEVQNIFHFVRDQIRYVQDVLDVETLHDAQRVLEAGQGDCDDKCILLAALLMSVGHPTRFVAIAQEPEQYIHVLVETQIGSVWVPLETTEPVEMGWYPEGVFSRLVIHN